MSVRAAVATGLLIVAAAAVSFRGVYEPDLWYHLAQGREVRSGHLVRTNVFSFTPPRLPSALHALAVRPHLSIG